MAEDNNNQNNQPPADPNNNQPPADGANNQPSTSGLPSDNQPQDFSGFELNDETKAKFKDGKLNGRFNNINEVLEKLKEAEDYKANNVRDQTNQQQTNQQEIDDAAALEATQATQQTTINEMLPQFIENNMELTADMEAKAVEVGIDIRDLKLGALELKDRVQKAHAVIGSSEEYNAMLAWGKENMTDSQKSAFDNDVTGGMSEYAIKGLHADYKAAGGVNAPRIAGETFTNSIKPYADRQELFKDREYLRSAAGKRDTAAKQRYNDRLKATSDAVIYGR